MGATFTNLAFLSRREFLWAVAASAVTSKLYAAEDAPFALGSGYRSASLSVGNRIVDQGRLPALTIGDAKVESQLGLVASQEDFESAFSADASISGSYGGFGGRARASLSKQYERHHTSVCLAFTRRVTTGVLRLAHFPVAAEAQQQANDVSRFVRVFGDSLITGVGVGGACCYMFRLDFSSEKQATDFRASIGGSYGTVSGDASTHLFEMAKSAKATRSFSGYTTGTLIVPELFHDQENASSLFSGTDDAAVTKLAKYFDAFPSNFEQGKYNSGYSQCEYEIDSLSMVPKILPNQDKIAELGDRCRVIAEALRRQRDTLESLDAQLDYMTGVGRKHNVKDALDVAPTMLADVSLLTTKVNARLTDLIQRTEVNAPYDFQKDIPSLPAHYCTADPIVTSERKTVPRGRSSNFRFALQPADYDRTVTIAASASFYAVGHRPNGGTLRIRLYKIPLPDPVEVPPVAFSGDPTGELVDEQSAGVTRGRSAAVSVGPITFIPSRDKCIYQLSAYSSGDYRSTAHANVTTTVSRQL